jgi:hypothetical protein
MMSLSLLIWSQAKTYKNEQPHCCYLEFGLSLTNHLKKLVGFLGHLKCDHGFMVKLFFDRLTNIILEY